MSFSTFQKSLSGTVLLIFLVNFPIKAYTINLLRIVHNHSGIDTNNLNGPKTFTQSIVEHKSDIPLIIITTKNGAKILDEPKIEAHMKVIDYGHGETNSASDSGNWYDGKIGIEIRGNFSAMMPQKPYLLETRTDSGTNNNISLLGMPKENDWILMANYNDRSFVRNSLAFQIFRNMGHYAPRTRLCEVYINNEYLGIYHLTEKIKRDKNRIDISKLKNTDIKGDELTGGYILKTDYPEGINFWESSFPPFIEGTSSVFHVFYYPKPDEINTVQKDYITNFFYRFENAMHSEHFNDLHQGYSYYIDENSFIDYFLVTELSRNVDGYKKSRYFYKVKDSKGGKLYSGPVWDFDWAWKNINDCPVYTNVDGSGWSWQAGKQCKLDVTPPMYTARLLQDTLFQQKLWRRYQELRQTCLSTEFMFHYIDSVADYLKEAKNRHFTKWNSLNVNYGTPEIEAPPGTFENEINRLKKWISLRLTWLDDQIPGVPEEKKEIEQEKFRIFPNPATKYVRIESKQKIRNIKIFDSMGLLITSKTDVNSYYHVFEVIEYVPGIYFISLENVYGKIQILKFIVK